jgi:hypothetical protein
MSVHSPDGNTRARYRFRLPKMLLGCSVGLGEIIQTATERAGITPCEPCKRRARKLDQWIEFHSHPE